MTEPTPGKAEVAQLIQIMRQVCPELQIRFKDEHWFWRRCPKRLRRAATTMFTTVWLSSRKRAESDHWGTFYTLAHEFVHVWDWVTKPFTFVLGYLMPQILGLLIPLALLPWPSPWRRRLEMRGYRMNMAIQYWRRGTITSGMKRWVRQAIRGPLYYWMVWRKEIAVEVVDRAEWEIKIGVVHRLHPVYKIVARLLGYIK